jgi:hypothetical protein
LASVLARETAIAASLARQITHTDAPTLARPIIERAIKMVEAGLDGPLSGEQRQAVDAICTSGRGAELVVGVAGAGKTTMLKAITAAFETAGCQVVGTATSGQAARTLGVEADIGESRTLSSLIWRLDHHQLTLDGRSVVICDEVGMTDDLSLARLATHVEVAGAKLVLVGDHRQLAAVGPGGALQALIVRHPDAVHRLVENRRQHNPAERQALAELRDGNVNRAVDWYGQQGRIHPVADRDAALQAVVDAWAKDIAGGVDTSMYAWRRVNVADLNRLARQWMDRTGRLRGPELVCPGGRGYRAGDHVIALAPAPNGSLVTSQRGTVESVDPERRALVIRTDDGQPVRLTGDQASIDRLDHGYATTIHRAQGATVTTAHLYADGGGRELAYVGLSRARESTHIWTLADNLPQACEDLGHDWAVPRSPTWAIDLGHPDTEPRPDQPDSQPPLEQVLGLALGQAAIELTRRAAAGVRPPDLGPAIAGARSDLRHALDAQAELQAGAGRYTDTPAGRAARDLPQARAARERAEWDAQHAPRRRDRRTAAKQADHWTSREGDAHQRYQHHTAPELERLDRTIESCHSRLVHLEDQQNRYQQAEQTLRGQDLDAVRLARRLSGRLGRYRDQLDGVPAAPAPTPLLNHPQRSQTPHRTIQPSPPRPRRGIGM